MEYWSNGVLGPTPIAPLQRSITPVSSSGRYFSLDFFEDLSAQSDVGDTLTGVVLVKSDLLRLSSSFLVARENLADFDQLLPADHAALDRIVNIGLFVLDRLLNRYDAVHMALSESRVIDLAPLGGGEAAFDEADVAADDRRDVLAGRSQLPSNTGTLELVAVKTISTPRTASRVNQPA